MIGVSMARKSYKFYLKVAANQILTKRGHCVHKEAGIERVVYWKCHECGAYVAFRNPEDLKIFGEVSKADAEWEFPYSHIEHIDIQSIDSLTQ